MYLLKCLYGVSDRAFDAFVKLFKRALPEDSTLPNSLKRFKQSLRNLIWAIKRLTHVPMTVFCFRRTKLNLANVLSLELLGIKQ